MNLPTKEVRGFFLVLAAPDIGTYSNIVTNAVREALERYLLDFAEPEEAQDDTWYYQALKDALFDLEGDVKTGAFLTWEEERMFIKDHVGQFNGYYQATAEVFENIIELNKESIQTLYEAVNIQEVDVIIYSDTIVLQLRGTSA